MLRRARRRVGPAFSFVEVAVRLNRLRVQSVRSICDAELRPGPGFNMLLGENGAGKTSVLEAVFLLSHGRSFRSGARDVLTQRGRAGFSVFAELERVDGALRRLGLGRERGTWAARVDGDGVASLGGLIEHCAVVCFEPGSHALIAGPSEERRRFLDWGVFHVERRFLEAWRRFQRALKQRNRLLRSGAAASDREYTAWEREMSATGADVDAWRAGYLARWEEGVRETCRALLPELGAAAVQYRRGWAQELDLDEALAERRDRDRQRGHTTIGIHRADWTLGFERAPQREHLSRGQEKLAALAAVLAQARVFADVRGEWPVICLDDLASELDAAHQERVIAALAEGGAQVLVTGTKMPEGLNAHAPAVFHVEQGQVRPLL